MGEINVSASEYIFKAIRKEMGITKEQIISQSRLRKNCDARGMYAVLMRQLTKHTYQEIGELIGSKHHATVHHSRTAMLNLLDVSKRHRMQKDAIIKMLPEDLSEPIKRCEHCRQIIHE
jgi:chromosomal replication initiation ATPase DnaA